MRAVLLAALLVALAPLAASAPSPLCQPDCRVEQNAVGYVSPLVVVPEGGAVVFASLDTTHITVGGAGVGGGFGCFFVASAPGNDAPPVAFDIDGGLLRASTDGGAPVVCEDAVELDEDAFALAYHCGLHPSMRGALVVTAAAG